VEREVKPRVEVESEVELGLTLAVREARIIEGLRLSLGVCAMMNGGTTLGCEYDGLEREPKVKQRRR